MTKKKIARKIATYTDCIVWFCLIILSVYQ